MNATDRLRRYLEQRREVGESELVLDALPVEELMALLGAKQSTSASSASPPLARAVAHTDPGAERMPSRAPDPSDPSRPDTGHPSGVLDSQALAGAVPPPNPDVRFDATATTNWRDVLRPTKADASNSEARKPDASSASASVPTDSEPATGATGASESTPSWLAAIGVPAGLSAGVSSDGGNNSTPSFENLAAVSAASATCRTCALHLNGGATAGSGNASAEVFCVIDAPWDGRGQANDLLEPSAHALLTKILAAIQLSPDDVYLTSVVKHGLVGRRDALPAEVSACQHFLRRELSLVQPRVIVAFGRAAAQALLSTSRSVGELRGQAHLWCGVPLVVTYHPSALLQNESWKRPTWVDVKLARRILDASRANTGD